MSDLDTFTRAVELARKRYPLMTVGTLGTFLHIVRADKGNELTPTAIAKRLGVPFTTIYRQCDQLCEGVRGQPGMKLVKKRETSTDGRARELVVTLEGLAFMQELRNVLDPEQEEHD
jgi:DNA-binding MarR family transcriptional regulator